MPVASPAPTLPTQLESHLQKQVDEYVRIEKSCLRGIKQNYLEIRAQRKYFMETVTALGLSWPDAAKLWQRTVAEAKAEGRMTVAELEAFLIDEFQEYIRRCLYDTPDFPWISLHELYKLLDFLLLCKGVSREVCDEAMIDRIFAVTNKFGLEPAEPPMGFALRVTHHPPLDDHVPDKSWGERRAHLLAMDREEMEAAARAM